MQDNAVPSTSVAGAWEAGLGMCSRLGFMVVSILTLFPARLPAGLYYSGEVIAPLPAQWRGFLVDQRLLRLAAFSPLAGRSASPMRQRYSEAEARLEKAGRERKLSADEAADLGALHIRLGEIEKALAELRAAHQNFPIHFRVIANLAAAWQMRGDLDQAARLQIDVVRLAPGKMQRAEELQLRLILRRQRQPRGSQELDDLFGIQYVGESGAYEPGRLAADQRKKLPADAAALCQQLALWFPSDGRLLWQLAELASAHGDVRTSAAIMDGCVTELGLHSPILRDHRRAQRAAADELLRNGGLSGDGRAKHQGHAGLLRPRSKRPLTNTVDRGELPPISRSGLNSLPWDVLGETILDRQFKPSFAKFLQELDGKRVSLAGYMQPVGEDGDLRSFLLIEYPVGCWYCEMPEMTGIVLVELEPGKQATPTRGLIKVTGELILNSSDPEHFLYTVRRATVAPAD